MIVARNSVSWRLNSFGFSIITKCPVPAIFVALKLGSCLLHVVGIRQGSRARINRQRGHRHHILLADRRVEYRGHRSCCRGFRRLQHHGEDLLLQRLWRLRREHAANHVFARLEPLRTGHLRAGRSVAARCSAESGHHQRTVHRHQSRDMLRIETRVLPDHRRAHAVPDQHDLVRLDFIAHRLDGAGEEVHREFAVRGRTALAVTGQIHGDDAVLPGELRHLGLPGGGVAGPAVNEDHGLFPLTGGGRVDLETVHRGGGGRRHEGGGNEQAVEQASHVNNLGADYSVPCEQIAATSHVRMKKRVRVEALKPSRVTFLASVPRRRQTRGVDRCPAPLSGRSAPSPTAWSAPSDR